MNVRKLVWIAIVAAGATWSLALVARGQDPAAPLDPRILAYDKGPAKIDVSKYPPPMQAAYKVFSVKCAKCHTLARPVNCELVLEDEWERYIKRMMRNAGSFITPDEGKTIYDFVVYDSKTRKKALYDKKKAAGGGASD